MLKIREILNTTKNRIEKDTKNMKFLGKFMYFIGCIKVLEYKPHVVVKVRKNNPIIILLLTIFLIIDRDLYEELKEICE